MQSSKEMVSIFLLIQFISEQIAIYCYMVLILYLFISTCLGMCFLKREWSDIQSNILWSFLFFISSGILHLFLSWYSSEIENCPVNLTSIYFGFKIPSYKATGIGVSTLLNWGSIDILSNSYSNLGLFLCAL